VPSKFRLRLIRLGYARIGQVGPGYFMLGHLMSGKATFVFVRP
jgi:hypothetical protein